MFRSFPCGAYCTKYAPYFFVGVAAGVAGKCLKLSIFDYMFDENLFCFRKEKSPKAA